MPQSTFNMDLTHFFPHYYSNKRSFLRESRVWFSFTSDGSNNLHACLLSHSVVSNSLWPHRLWPTRLHCPRDFPGKKTGVELPLPPPGDGPDPGIELTSPALAGRLFTTASPEKPAWDNLKTNKRTASSQISLTTEVNSTAWSLRAAGDG